MSEEDIQKSPIQKVIDSMKKDIHYSLELKKYHARELAEAEIKISAIDEAIKQLEAAQQGKSAVIPVPDALLGKQPTLKSRKSWWKRLWEI